MSFFLDPRFGRGFVLAAALSILVGFVLPFVRARGVRASALELAIEEASNMWMVPAAAIGVITILAFRRNLAQLHTSRVAIVALCTGGVLPVAYTMRRIAIMARVEVAEPTFLVGAWWMIVSLILCGLSAIRLGSR